MQKNTIVAAAIGIVAAAGIGFGGAALANARQSPTATSTPNATSTTTPGQSSTKSPGQSGKHGDKAQEQARLLSGDTAVKVTQAVTAKEPTAKLERIGSDGAGGYVARMIRTDGTRIMLQLDASFNVTKDEVAPSPKAGKKDTGTKTQSPTSSGTTTS